jgi:hypothetical protein
MPSERSRTVTDTRDPAAIWEEALDRLLTSGELYKLLGLSPEELARLEGAGEVIVLRVASGERRYPAFQFEGGAPIDGLARAHATMARAESPWTAASWCVSEHPELGGSSPREWATAGKDVDRLCLTAARDSARLAH